MQTVRVPESRCPTCGYLLDSITSMNKNAPKPGGITVCVKCTTVLVIGTDMLPILATEEFLNKLPPRVLAKINKIKLVLKNAVNPDKLSKR